MNISLSENNNIAIDFEYDINTNLNIINKLISLPEKECIDDGKWIVPYSEEVLLLLQKWKFNTSENLKEFILQERERKKNFSVAGLKGTLRPFQTTGVSFIQDHNGKCILCDDMGIGKTIQAIGYIHLNRQKTVIICPSSIKLNWQRELEKWLDNPNVEILKGIKPYKTTGDILIINYDILYAWTDRLKDCKILILDEFQAIKNTKAKRSKAVKRLKDIPHIIGLSGTPILNRPDEIYNISKLVKPELFGTFKHFKSEYNNGHDMGWEFNGTEHIHRLHFKLSATIMLRRLKKDVLTELPDKTYSFVPIELTNESEYRSAEADFISWVRRNKGDESARKAELFEGLVKVEGLKQIATRGKMLQVIEWIKDFLETDNKLVVFCTHTAVVDSLMTEFECAVKIDGSTKDRQMPVDAFQNDPKTRLFVGNIKCASEGITLTASSNVAFLELPWSPKNIDQASDRVHRIGQKDAVTVYYLLAQNTIEERIAKLLDKKRNVIDNTMDGKNPEKESLLLELINSYKNI